METFQSEDFKIEPFVPLHPVIAVIPKKLLGHDDEIGPWSRESWQT